MSRFTKFGVRHAEEIDWKSLACGMTLELWVYDDNQMQYSVVIDDVQMGSQHSGNAMTILGNTAYLGFPTVNCVVWLKPDGKACFGIDDWHVTRLEAEAQKAPQKAVQSRFLLFR
jgi:hypothetical protein